MNTRSRQRSANREAGKAAPSGLRWLRRLRWACAVLLAGVGLQFGTVLPAQGGNARTAPDHSPYPGHRPDPRGDWDGDGLVNGMDPDDDNDGIPDFEDPEPYSRMPVRGGARKPEPDRL